MSAARWRLGGPKAWRAAALVTCSALTAVAFVVLAPGWFISWPFIVKGARSLVSVHWLDLYGRHPDLQMGPLTFALFAPIVLLLPLVARHVVASVVMLLCGLVAVHELGRLVSPDDVGRRRRWFLGGLVVLAGWSELAVRYAHADDVLALLWTVLGIGLLRRSHPLLAGLVIGLAVDSKPWALPFVALLVLAEPRKRLPAIAVAGAVVLVAWAPFVVGSGGMQAALHFRIPIEHASTLRLLGIRHGTPPWCRPAQLIGGAALLLLAIRRSRWQAAILVVVAARLLLDPAVKPYYDAGLLLGALLFDLGAVVPIATIVALLGVALPSLLLTADPTARGVLRTAALVVLLVAGELMPQAGPAVPWRSAPPVPPGGIPSPDAGSEEPVRSTRSSGSRS